MKICLPYIRLLGSCPRAQESMLMLDAAKIDYVWDKDTANKWKSETESPKKICLLDNYLYSS